MPSKKLIETSPGFCATSLNATHLMVIAYHHHDDDTMVFNRRSAIVSFADQVWFQTPLLPGFNIDNFWIVGRQATVTITKKGHIQVYFHIQLYKTFDCLQKDRLLLFDLSATINQWIIISEFVKESLEAYVIKMLTFKGMPISIMNDGSLLNHQTSKITSNHSLESILNVIPFYA